MEQSFNWIISCIESSTNEFQFKCCQTLIKLFETMYEKENECLGKTIDLSFALDEQKVKHNIEI